MMRSFSLSAIIYIFYLFFQAVDIPQFIDKYGFPTLIAVAMFIYFSRQLGKKDSDLDEHRKEMLKQSTEQTEYLKSMLEEQKRSDFCKFK